MLLYLVAFQIIIWVRLAFGQLPVVVKTGGALFRKGIIQWYSKTKYYNAGIAKTTLLSQLANKNFMQKRAFKTSQPVARTAAEPAKVKPTVPSLEKEKCLM